MAESDRLLSDCTPIKGVPRVRIPLSPPVFAPIAQLDRAPDYESGGRRFESFWARQITFRIFPQQQGGDRRRLVCHVADRLVAKIKLAYSLFSVSGFASFGKFPQKGVVKQSDVCAIFLDQFFIFHISQRAGKRFRSGS